MDIVETLKELCTASKKAGRQLALSSLDQRNAVLKNIASNLKAQSEAIITANEKDLDAAVKSGLSEAMCDRLKLTQARIDGIAAAMEKLIALPDPLGISSGWRRPNGLYISKETVPLGTVGIIYEARPNVTVDAAALCIKSGNCAVLRGGKEAYNTNLALEAAIKEALSAAGLSPDCVSLIHDVTRESSLQLMKLSGYIDVLIPRGSASLIQSVVQNSTVPVIETGAGNCHVYIDRHADPELAKKIAVSAKISRPSVCNAEEKLLIHKDIAKTLLPDITAELKKNGVTVKGDERVCKIVDAIPATEEDLRKEYNDYVITVYCVDSVDAAIEHINAYNTGHSEAIITKDEAAAEKFLSGVDAAVVYLNASTRFTDGEEFGFGAEIGISTQKLHARGPCGLNELTTCKYKIRGNGQIR